MKTCKFCGGLILGFGRYLKGEGPYHKACKKTVATDDIYISKKLKEYEDKKKNWR